MFKIPVQRKLAEKVNLTLCTGEVGVVMFNLTLSVQVR